MSNSSRIMFYIIVKEKRYRKIYRNREIEKCTRTMFYNNILEERYRRML